MDILSAVIELTVALKYSSIGVWLPQVFLLKEQKYKTDSPHCNLTAACKANKTVGTLWEPCGTAANLVIPRFHQMLFGHQSNVAQ